MSRKLTQKFLAVYALFASATMAMADSIVPADYAIDTGDVSIVVGAILMALGGIWIAKRVIGFMGR